MTGNATRTGTLILIATRILTLTLELSPRNPHNRLPDTRESAEAEREPTGDRTEEVVASVTDVDSGYIPIGHNLTNSEGRVCVCGSATHVTRQHSMCPLNSKSCPQLTASAQRLRLYLHRRVWRYWDYEDGSRKKCHGTVTKLDGTGTKLSITYDEGGIDVVSEHDFLTIVRQMRKDITNERRSRKRKGTLGVKRSRKHMRM